MRSPVQTRPMRRTLFCSYVDPACCCCVTTHLFKIYYDLRLEHALGEINFWRRIVGTPSQMCFFATVCLLYKFCKHEKVPTSTSRTRTSSVLGIATSHHPQVQGCVLYSVVSQFLVCVRLDAPSTTVQITFQLLRPKATSGYEAGPSTLPQPRLFCRVSLILKSYVLKLALWIADSKGSKCNVRSPNKKIDFAE